MRVEAVAAFAAAERVFFGEPEQDVADTDAVRVPHVDRLALGTTHEVSFMVFDEHRFCIVAHTRLVRDARRSFGGAPKELAQFGILLVSASFD